MTCIASTIRSLRAKLRQVLQNQIKETGRVFLSVSLPDEKCDDLICQGSLGTSISRQRAAAAGCFAHLSPL
jgi:hypothetical protein